MGRPKQEKHAKRINITISPETYEDLQYIRKHYNKFNLSHRLELYVKFIAKEIKQKQLKLF